MVEIVKNLTNSDVPHYPTQKRESNKNSEAVEQNVPSVGTVSHARNAREIRERATLPTNCVRASGFRGLRDNRHSLASLNTSGGPRNADRSEGGERPPGQ